MKNNNYVFSAALAAVALSGVPGLFEAKAKGAVIAGFSFDGSNNNTVFPSGTFTTTAAGPVTVTNTSTAGVTAASVGPLLAESGTGSAYGVHASTATAFSEPAGNGSGRSFSANRFALGDYYQFTVPTTGFSNITLSFDQTSSGTGPKLFNISYSVDGTNFSTFTSYSFATVAFNVTASNTAAAQSFNLSGLTGLNNDASAIFRLVNADTSIATTVTGGTDRVDNFIVNGSVPEPASLALATAVSGLVMARRRK